MPRYAVYHARDPLQMMRHDASPWQADRALHYQHVADVEAEACDRPLSRVFRLTNHLDPYPWMEHPAVVWHDATRPLRSTSVGDVIGDETGQAWMVLVRRFTRLADPDEERL